jgi:hypothetical protein
VHIVYFLGKLSVNRATIFLFPFFGPSLLDSTSEEVAMLLSPLTDMEPVSRDEPSSSLSVPNIAG